MILQLLNQTAAAKTYASGSVTLPASANVTVPIANQLASAVDGNLFSDVSQGNVFISDTINVFVRTDGLNYLNRLIATFVGLYDGFGNPITSTAINSKQRIDINTSADGVDGSAAPYGSLQVAGKDPNGNLQAILTDINGNIGVLLKDASSNNINSYNSQLETADIINTALSSGSISVSTSSVAARVGASNLANRKMLTISPQNGTVYLGASSAVTTATGIPIFQNQVISFAFSANVTPFLIAASAITVSVMEGS